ncbi:MAG: nucleotide exchange factor GrpE [Spirochaetia bacterium]|nr:nucleotide exchange factor GrpE [Spirochaetia bacterium]
MAKQKEDTTKEDLKEQEENIKDEDKETEEKPEAQNSETIDEDKIKSLSEEVASLKDSLMRERAEFMNYKKRTAQERISHEAAIVGRFVQDLMPALDSFDSMFQSAEESNNKKEDEGQTTEKFIEGASMIHKQFLEVFNKFGVEEVNPVDEEFNPTTMEAISVQESEEVEKETVKQVFQKGYVIKEKILRPARVLVMKPANAK